MPKIDQHTCIQIKKIDLKVLLQSFHLNGDITDFFSHTRKLKLHHISNIINSMWKMKGNRLITSDSSVSPRICKLINHPYNIYGTCIDYWKVSERSKEAIL